MAWTVHQGSDTGVALTVYPMIQEWPDCVSYDTGVAWTVYPMIQEWPGLCIRALIQEWPGLCIL